MSSQPCGCDPEAGWVCRDCCSATMIRGFDRRAMAVPPRGTFWVDSALLQPPTQAPTPNSPIQEFTSGATRNLDTDKFDYEGFLNPEALHAFGEYMHTHRRQKDGSVRDSDNWQKGIPFRVYAKSLVRHVIDLWRMERGFQVMNPDTNLPHTKQELCCAIVFNAMGYLKELVDPGPINQCKSVRDIVDSTGQMKANT